MQQARRFSVAGVLTAAFIEQIRSNSGNLLQLVNNILLLSRIDAKMLEIVPQPTDFGELFNASCLMGVSRGVNEGVETKFETRDEPLILEIDNAQMRHIMETLTLLSARFTQKGLIHTRYEYRNGQLTFSIKDTGAGMDKACISRILKREYNQGMMGDYNVELEQEHSHIIDTQLGETELPDDVPVARGGRLSAWVPIMYG